MNPCWIKVLFFLNKILLIPNFWTVVYSLYISNITPTSLALFGAPCVLWSQIKSFIFRYGFSNYIQLDLPENEEIVIKYKGTANNECF